MTLNLYQFSWSDDVIQNDKCDLTKSYTNMKPLKGWQQFDDNSQNWIK